MEETIKKPKEEKNAPIVCLSHLTKRYGGLVALDDVSLEIGRGEVVGLLGPNGAGKSTAMNILTGYLSADGGQAMIGGVDILTSPGEAKKQIGYLPEQPPLYPDMTVREYLHFVFSLKKCNLDREAHLADIMQGVRITEVADRLIRNLSKGYRQRVGMAEALVGDPPVLIFDEPTVGLDPKQIIEVRSLIRTLGRRHTVILSTHILSEVQAVCERIVIMNRGHVIANQKTEDLAGLINDRPRYRYRIAAPADELLRALSGKTGIAKAELLRRVSSEETELAIEFDRGVDGRRAVFSLCAASRFPILELSPIGADLEEIFLRLTGKDENKK